MTTVHLVLNAHVDPIWLWPWPSGLDELLNTCRSACDRLEAHPDVQFCRGEAWAYERIERADPDLFERIRRHIVAGRWHIVGGWWIQPDCNGPSGFGFERQIAAGKAYFLDRFGFFPRAGYNVDSFGHAATLPALLRAAGQDAYVMMRPQEHEMTLPARVFRWRGHVGGPEVVTFRIAKTYAIRELSVEHVRSSLTDLPPGIAHTLCFIGAGDHGGGATERQIAWLHEHRDRIPGCRLEFSSPDRFFDAIWEHRETLPLVTGELQMHAVGCYSVYRPIKVGVRRAEHALRQAELVQAAAPAGASENALRLAEAWRHVAFCQFHDTYGGTCVPSAYPQALAMLGAAATTADEILQVGLRRQAAALPDDPCQRIVLHNASDATYDGYAEHEPHFEHTGWQPHWRLIDEAGQPVAFQLVHPEAQIRFDVHWFVRLLFRVRAEPGAHRVLRIDTGSTDATPKRRAGGTTTGAATGVSTIANDLGVGVRLPSAPGDTGELRFVAGTVPLPRLDLIEDLTDTWSHDIDRYDDSVVAHAQWQPPQVLDTGPLMFALQQAGTLDASRLLAEYRVYAGEPFVELRLRVQWAAQHSVLKLTLELPAPATRRTDGIPGGELERALDGKEYPVRDRILLDLAGAGAAARSAAGGARLGLVFPDVYAGDVLPTRARLTLLRSPLMAHHDPYRGPMPRGCFADRGEHEFRFRWFYDATVTGAALDQHALMLQRPLVAADLTRGMPAT
jgi:alpha-mannosidase